MKIKRIFLLFMTLVLMVSMLPTAYAAEADEALAVTEDTPMLTASSQIKQGTLRNCDQMNMRLNGSVTQGFHFYDEDGVAPWDYSNMLYCLEQNKDFHQGAGGTGMGNVSFDGSGSTHSEDVWYSLSADQRFAIGLILMYGAPTKIWDDSWGFNAEGDWNMHNPNIGYRFATQALIWEITGGSREPIPPYTRTRSYWYDLAVGMCVSEDGSVDYFKLAYDQIVSDLQSHNVIPSFTGDFAATAPEINLTGSSTTLTDTNGVLSKFSFTNTEGITYTKSGNDLVVSVSGDIPSAVQNAIATLPAPESALYEVWGNEADYSKQVCVKISVPASDPVPAYFKFTSSIPTQTATLSIKKTTEDVKNLAGWEFNLYSDEACTKLLSGPHVTDSSGSISVSELTPGDVWVKEIGHRNASIDAQYIKDSSNPKKTSIILGQTSVVNFYNKLPDSTIVSDGNLKIIKTLKYPKIGTVAGWTFSISRLIEVGNYTRYVHVADVTTGASGVIAYDLAPGTYRVTEVLDNNIPWENVGSSTRTVSIEEGDSASVSFTNAVHLGKISIKKIDTRGTPLEGVEFLLEWSHDGQNWTPVSYAPNTDPKPGGCSSAGLSEGKLRSDKNGLVTFDGLDPFQLYRLTETSTNDGYVLLEEPAFEGNLPEEIHPEISITVVNADAFTLPNTGSGALSYLPFGIIAFAAIGAITISLLKRRGSV